MSKKGVYLRGIFPSRHKELCNILMCLDTGNLNQSVMSFKCAKDLGLTIQQTKRTATGVDGNHIDIMGEVGPIKFNIDQPCNKEFYEKFIVIDKMSVPINLSCEFMMKHSIECRHSLKGNVVCIDNFELPLTTIGERSNLISQLNNQPNKTYTFQEPVSDPIPGLNNNQEIPVVDLGPQKVSILSNETLLIPALTTITLEALCTVTNLTEKTGLGYISPRQMGKRNILMLEGVVNCKKPTFNVNISNFEEVPVTVQKGSKIGFIWSHLI